MIRCIIKYISLLLVSGLILPFYYSVRFKAAYCKVLPNFGQITTRTAQPDSGPQPESFIFIKEFAGDLFPVLKNL